LSVVHGRGHRFGAQPAGARVPRARLAACRGRPRGHPSPWACGGWAARRALSAVGSGCRAAARLKRVGPTVLEALSASARGLAAPWLGHIPGLEARRVALLEGVASVLLVGVWTLARREERARSLGGDLSAVRRPPRAPDRPCGVPVASPLRPAPPSANTAHANSRPAQCPHSPRQQPPTPALVRRRPSSATRVHAASAACRQWGGAEMAAAQLPASPHRATPLSSLSRPTAPTERGVLPGNCDADALARPPPPIAAFSALCRTLRRRTRAGDTLIHPRRREAASACSPMLRRLSAMSAACLDEPGMDRHRVSAHAAPSVDAAIAHALVRHGARLAP